MVANNSRRSINLCRFPFTFTFIYSGQPHCFSYLLFKMAPALSTTKRKFHKILDSISNASSTSHASTHKHNASTTTLCSTLKSPAKRTKLDRPIFTYVGPGKRFKALPAPSNRATAIIMLPPDHPYYCKRDQPPRYTPCDGDQFLERLQTFSNVHKWSAKPDRINEVEWAKRGWSCTGPETVECVKGCGESMILSLPEAREDKETQEEQTIEEERLEYAWREEVTTEKVEKYVSMIVAAHLPGCPWFRKGCDSRIQHINVGQYEVANDSLIERYHSLTPMESELPPNISTPKDFDIESMAKALGPLFGPPIKFAPRPSSRAKSTTANSGQFAGHAVSPPLTPTRRPPPPPNQTGSPPLYFSSPTRTPPRSNKQFSEPTQIPTSPTRTPSPPPTQRKWKDDHPLVNNAALTLALFGWQAEKDRKPNDPAVVTCTSCFRRLGLWLYRPDPETGVSNNEDLYVLSEHRNFCPWINALAQHGPPRKNWVELGPPAWKGLMDMLIGYFGTRSSDEEDEPVRNNSASWYDDKFVGDASEVVNVETTVSVSRQETEPVVSVSRQETETKDEERRSLAKKMSLLFHVGGKKKKGDDSPGRKDGAAGEGAGGVAH